MSGCGVGAKVKVRPREVAAVELRPEPICSPGGIEVGTGCQPGSTGPVSTQVGPFQSWEPGGEQTEFGSRHPGFVSSNRTSSRAAQPGV